MDLGVGSFVFSQGLVSAIPLLKDPAYLSAAPIPKIINATRKVLPVLALGAIRVILVKGTEYPVSALPCVIFYY
jgi:glucosaminylphosphatidylinositol acyltransferase